MDEEKATTEKKMARLYQSFSAECGGCCVEQSMWVPNKALALLSLEETYGWIFSHKLNCWICNDCSDTMD